MNIQSVVKVAKDAGFSGHNLVIAVAIAIAESSLNENALGDTTLTNRKWGPSYGLWQIRSLTNPNKYNYPDNLRVDDGSLCTPSKNAEAAFAIFSKYGWEAWSTYKNGDYKKYMSKSLDAVSKVLGDIEGAGGGKGGRTAVEAPNTLQSRATVKLVEVLSEGPVEGVIGGLKGVFFDDTPVQNSDDSFNFPAIKYEERFGLWDGYSPVVPAQEYMPGFPSVESAVNVNVELNSAGVTRSVSASDIDAVRVQIRLPQGLYAADEKTGDVNGYRVGIEIDTRLTSGGTWQTVFTKTITGKTINPYEEAYRIERPNIGGTGLWQIRVRKTTASAASSLRITDRADWFTLTEIKDIKVTYDGAAVVGLAVDSESTGGAVPRRSYLLGGRLIDVPHNYSPRVYNNDGTIAVHASYSGVFNGSLVGASRAVDNPAWVLYDILTNDRYGLGDYLNANNIDIYSFYDAAQYCDELIDNGMGGLEPRYRFNAPLQTREDAFKAVQAISSNMRAMVFVASGLIRIIQDRPSNPVASLNNSNVIDGKFIYSSDDLSTRTTACTVTFNDALDRYLPKTIIEEASSANINRYGYNKLELGVIGVVHESQARRMAKWAIETSLNETEAVSFTVSWSNAFVEVGDVVTIADNFYANYTIGGSIVGGSTSTIILDRPVTITAGSSIKYMRWDGEEVTRTISNGAGTYTTLNINLGENVSLYAGSAWALFSNIVPRYFKISGVKETDVGMYELTAISYDPTKYARIESGISIDPPVFGNIEGQTIAAPTNLVIEPETAIDPNGVVRYKLRLDWDNVDDVMLKSYKIRYRRNNNQFEWTSDILQSEYILDNIETGIYEFYIYAYSTKGAQSPPLTGSYNLSVGNGSASPIGAPTALQLDGGLTSTTFGGTAFKIKWNAPIVLNGRTILDYKVEFISGGVVKQTLYTADTSLFVTKEEIVAWFGYAVRSFVVKVYTRDTLQNLSLSVTNTFSNPAPAAPTGVTITPRDDYYELTHAAGTGDYLGTLIYHSTTSGFTPSASTLVKRDAGVKHIVEADPSTTYYVRVAFYDEWSENGPLNFAAQATVTTGSGGPVVVVPTDPTGLSVTSSIVNSGNAQQYALITITWAKATNADQYDLEIIEGTTNAYYPTVAQPLTGSTVTYLLKGVPGVTYKVRVRSRNGTSVSAYSTQVVHVASGDTTAPAVPTIFSISAGYQSAVLKWTNATDSDLQGVQVWRRPSGNSTDGTLITTVARPLSTYFDTNLTIGSTFQYRIRSVDISGNFSAYTAWTNVTAINVPDQSIGANQIVANSITANQIAAGTITANKIAAGTITANQIAANTLTAENMRVGTITGGVDATRIAIVANATGIKNPSFNPDVNGVIYDAALQSDGKLIIVGEFTSVNGTTRNNMARFNADGSLDTFNPNVNGRVNCVTIRTDGVIVIGGLFSSVLSNTRNNIAYINSAGTINTINPNANGEVLGVAVDASNRVSIVGKFTSVLATTRKYAARITSTGTLDTSFNPNFNAAAYCVAVDTSSRVVIGGNFTTTNGTSRARIARYASTGGLDTTFNTSGLNGICTAVACVGSDIYAGGLFTSVGATGRQGLAKFSTTGGLNLTYVPYLDTAYSTYVRKIIALADTNILTVGDFIGVNNQLYSFAVKLNATSGALDTQFMPNVGDSVNTAVQLGDGQIVLAGKFTALGGIIRVKSIEAEHIKANAITAELLAAGSVTANAVAANQIITNTANIADAVITNAKITGAIQSSNYTAGANGWKIDKTNGFAEFGEVYVRGEIGSSSINSSIFSADSLRILTAANKLAPFTIHDMGYQASPTTGVAGSVTLQDFLAPNNGTNFTYNAKRFAHFKKDVYLEATVFGNGGVEEVVIEVQYDGGTWLLINSLISDLTNRSGLILSLRYTTKDSGWSTVAFRARTLNSRTNILSFKMNVDNFNESGNTPESNSGVSSAPSTGGGGILPPGGDPWCVDYYTSVLSDGRYVRNLSIGDMVEVWDDDAIFPEIELRPVRHIAFGVEQSYMLITESGAALIQSASTPMTLMDGSIAYTTEMLGEKVLVNRYGVLTWEPVIGMVDVGERKVVKVDLGDRMYFAGMKEGVTFATHNIIKNEIP